MSRVLYVEDECLLQLDGEAWLRAAGHEVILASDGESASAFLREGGAPFDGLVSDIDLPVVYVSGHALADFHKMGVPDSIIMPKPFEWRRLVTSLSSLMVSAGPEAPCGFP